MGLGYIGLPTAIIAAKHGIQVTGVDINPRVVEMTNQGRLHIIEPGMEEMLREVVANGNLRASTTPEVSDAYFMVVPTPFKGNHEPDISYVEAATRAVLPYLKEGDLYVIESTSPVGTTDKMRDLIFSERPELRDKIYIAYCPERVLPGNVIYELTHNDRVIGGVDEASTTKAIEFYSRFVQGTLHRTNCKTAEMCKLTENSSRDVQIAFANELSFICDKAGIDVWELIRLANKHPRVNILWPGCGVGGHCIAVDPYFITPDDRHGAGDQQLQGVLVRGEGGERHAALRAGAPSQALRGDDGPGLQAEHRRPARVAGEIHRLEGDAGPQQRRHPRGGAERAGAQRVQADRLPGGVRAGGHRGDARGPRPVQDAAPERRQDRPGLLRDLREVRRRSHRMEA